MNICQYLVTTAQSDPNKVLTICGHRRCTAAELAQRVAALSASLSTDYGVLPGDRVALAALQSDLCWEVVLAVFAAGAVLVPINWRWSLQDAVAALAPCEPRVLIHDTACSRFAACQRQCSIEHVIAVDQNCDAASIGAASGLLTVADHHRGALILHAAVDDMAVICFTSGTTGPAKGAVLTHTAFHCQALAKVLTVGYSQSDIYLHSSPLCHVGALSSAFAILLVGGVQVFIPRFEPAAFISALQRHNVTAFIAVPTMLSDIVGSPHPLAIKSVQRILVGAGPLRAHIQRACHRLFPEADLHTAYGMTEACSSVTFLSLTPGGRSSKLRGCAAGICVGRPPPGIEICIRPGDEGTGEVWTRGPHVMLRYWGSTLGKEPGGWFRTGDLGIIDRDGILWLFGRLKDVIRSGGENVHAFEVEAMLERHPYILRAAVVAVPHDRFQEQVACALQLSAHCRWNGDEMQQTALVAGSSLGLDDVRSFCQQQGLSTFKLPRVVVAQYDPLPTTATGKVMKGAVRTMIAQSESFRKFGSRL